MQRLRGYFSIAVMAGLVGVSLWAVMIDIDRLVDSGGWFAVFGQFTAIFFTLGLAIMLTALCVFALFLPVLVYFVVAEQRGSSPSIDAEKLYRIANTLWKVIWRISWLLRRLCSGKR